MDFVAIDFETTGYDNGSANEPWQLGLAVVEHGRIVETREALRRALAGPPRWGHSSIRLRYGRRTCSAEGSSRTTSPVKRPFSRVPRR